MAKKRRRLALLRELIAAESARDIEGVLDGFTHDGFNDIACVAKPFVGPRQVAERYRKHWAGFPDFKVRIVRLLATGERCFVTENEWTGVHRGTFMGLPPTGRRVRVRTLVVWHFRGDKLHGETVFFDMGSVLKQIGGRMVSCRARPSDALPERFQRTRNRDFQPKFDDGGADVERYTRIG